MKDLKGAYVKARAAWIAHKTECAECADNDGETPCPRGDALVSYMDHCAIEYTG